MKTFEEQYREFAAKHGFPTDEPLKPGTPWLHTAVRAVGGITVDFAKTMEGWNVMPLGDHDRLLVTRVALMLEELGELIQALAESDREGAMDGLADLAYVVTGTAVAYGVPLTEAFAEVHRSNMTKAVRTPQDRLRDKGSEYRPPDWSKLKGVQA